MTGFERKILEQEIIMDFVHGMQSVAEYIERREFADAVWNIPEITPEIPVRDSGYIGKHEKNVSVYDAMMAEIHADKDARVRKFERTHKADNSKKDKTNADRRKDRKNRLHRLYGLAFEDTKNGKTVYYWDKKEGKKKFPEYEAEILRNMKDAELEKSAYADMMPDMEHHVGYNTVQRIMYNADKRMREIRAEMCAYRDDDETVETYDDSYMVIYADGMGYQHPYPDEYYNEKATWEGYEYMIRKYGMEYANKYAKGDAVK